MRSPFVDRAALPPLLLVPHYVQKPWGGRRLADELGRVGVPHGPIGESWDVADLPEHASRVEGGPFAGRSLREVWGEPYPLLLKVLDARQDLSVQVHPDALANVPAKEEAWIALGPDARVACGSLAGCTLPGAGQWLDALREETPLPAAEGRAPQMLHVPPGTVHAILGGSLLLEVQNPAGTTWRLDDFERPDLDGRPRALHLQEAASVLARGPTEPRANAGEAGRLVGRRFSLEWLPPGHRELPASRAARAVFCWGASRVAAPGGSLQLPAWRATVLPCAHIALVAPSGALLATAS